MVPEDVTDSEAANRRQAAGPPRVAMVGGPHLNDDKGQNRGVLGVGGSEAGQETGLNELKWKQL